MNIDLKLKFNYRNTVFLFSALTVLFGAIGISYKAFGIVLIPLISSFLAILFCVEKKKAAFIITSAILIVVEIISSVVTYYNVISLSSISLALIIAICYLKGIKKSEGALYSTIAIFLFGILIASLYVMGKTNNYSFASVYDEFILAYDNYKLDVISRISEIPDNMKGNSDLFTPQYITLLFDAFLDCIIAFGVILSFLIVGVTYKIFTKLLHVYSKDTDKVLSFDFIPSKAFAYFYFIVAIISAFTAKDTGSLSISIMNLFLIFEIVFAYFGFKFVTTIFTLRKQKSGFTPIIILLLVLVFSSLAVQLLAIVGAFVCTKQKIQNTN